MRKTCVWLNGLCLPTTDGRARIRDYKTGYGEWERFLPRPDEGGYSLKMLERFWTGCGHCRGDAAKCPISEQLEQFSQTPLVGVARLPIALTSLLVFLFPLSCGLLGAYFLNRWESAAVMISSELRQIGGFLIGTAVGVGAAKVALFALDRFWTFPDRGGE